MAFAGWDKQAFNEKNPWGKGSTVITEDNAAFSTVRRAAIIAVKARTATPEQTALVAETDAAMAEAVAGRAIIKTT